MESIIKVTDFKSSTEQCPNGHNILEQLYGKSIE